jgi:hypothetical protein
VDKVEEQGADNVVEDSREDVESKVFRDSGVK